MGPDLDGVIPILQEFQAQALTGAASGGLDAVCGCAERVGTAEGRVDPSDVLHDCEREGGGSAIVFGWVLGGVPPN